MSHARALAKVKIFFAQTLGDFSDITIEGQKANFLLIEVKIG